MSTWCCQQNSHSIQRKQQTTRVTVCCLVGVGKCWAWVPFFCWLPWCSSGPGIPNHSVFLFTSYRILLWLPFELFLGFIIILSWEEQGEMSLCYLVQTGSRRPILQWFLLQLLLGMTHLSPFSWQREAQEVLLWLM